VSSSPSIHWGGIRAYGGSQHSGFEELCAQLARRESPPESVFTRKGTPDSGVECFATLPGGEEWAWQAKYIHSFTNRWSQIDGSVQKALDGHPALSRYYVCVPFDLPDGRRAGQTSAREAWAGRVSRWSEWATDRGMDVEFVLWGASEMVDRLTRPENVGLVRYWFDTSAFGPDWFRARLEDSVRAAGPRYTPEAHVDLPISKAFEALGRTPAFVEGVRSKTRGLRKAQRDARITNVRPILNDRDQASRPAPHVWDDDVLALSEAAQVTTETAIAEAVGFEGRASGAPGLGALAEATRAATAAAGALDDRLWDLFDTRERRTGLRDPVLDIINSVHVLRATLEEFSRYITKVADLAGAQPMLLKGAAGTGKTHLLCDIARARVEAGLPTVLLMGQRFLGAEEPWTQALRQLDLPGTSAQEFIGALEAAAEASGARALVLIDALNEGRGREIWPAHLAPFLAALERSEWVSVCVSVRSSYERVVIPETVHSGAVTVMHEGFSDREFDAVATFFDHYGIERPSAPLLNPEFQNPLFLKTLCVGLHRPRRVVQLPRGFHGVTRVFGLYLSAVNRTLARDLGYAVRRDLVQKGVEALVREIGAGADRWVRIEEAERVLDPLLPSRDDDRSLLTGLLREGVLISEGGYTEDGPIETIQVAFDRLADYLVADLLLEGHETVEAVMEDGTLADVLAEPYVRPGLVEALCVRLPEAFGVELADLVPDVLGRWSFGRTFRRSVVWRASDAVTDRTLAVLDGTTRDDEDDHAAMETILTVATLPGHPLNALYLHGLLASTPLPERDAWWSVFLHHAWERQGSAARRLVNWAWREGSGDGLDDEGIDLTATALGWTLTSSHRYLRDRSTKALVSLLTDRLDAVERMIERFADVDDPYVAERVYAVACGCVLRCHDAGAVARLAQAVFDRVFRDGTPPPHVLLRDYARVVVERALYLDPDALDGDPERTRPPYRSAWPRIPTEEEVERLKHAEAEPPKEEGSYRPRNRIYGSVFDDDFGHYVIGSRLSWLSVRLDEPEWMSSADKLAALRATFSPKQTDALRAFEAAERELDRWQAPLSAFSAARFRAQLTGEDAPDPEDYQEAEFDDAERAVLRSALNAAIDELAACVPNDALNKYEELRQAPPEEAPLLDRGVVQRYVVWRALDLGWSLDLHGGFDRNVIGYTGRAAGKAERIGKKYQWIAYHEILAYVSDRFQYREEFGGGERAYVGPWQDSLRDIDPSCTLRSVEGGTGWGSHETTWWATPVVDDWETPERHEEWFVKVDDLPDVGSILAPQDPEGTPWMTLDAYLTWRQPHPPDRDALALGVRETWYILHAYLMRAEDVGPFMEWAQDRNFYGRWMPEPATRYRVFLGEFGWPSEAATYFDRPYYGGKTWVRPDRGCPVDIANTVVEYAHEGSGFDCSVEDGYQLRMPSRVLADALDLRWSGWAADFIDRNDVLRTQDPTVRENGANACLVRRSGLAEALSKVGLGICWTLLGEKRYLTDRGRGDGVTDPVMGHISGAFTLTDDGIQGSTAVFAEHWSEDGQVVSDFVVRAPLMQEASDAEQ
jgi:hypothetical protein